MNWPKIEGWVNDGNGCSWEAIEKTQPSGQVSTTVCTKWSKFCNPPGAPCYSGNEWSDNPPDFPRWGCHDRKHIEYIGPFGSTWQQRARKRSARITWFCYKQIVCMDRKTLNTTASQTGMAYTARYIGLACSRRPNTRLNCDLLRDPSVSG